MKIEQQVTSLEISKRLKELGVKQESLFKWNFKLDEDDKISHTELVFFPIPAVNQDISAFTVAELGEILLVEVQKGKVAYWFNQAKMSHGWAVGYRSNSKGLYEDKQILDKTEADARGKMLIYLLENNLINL